MFSFGYSKVVWKNLRKNDFISPIYVPIIIFEAFLSANKILIKKLIQFHYKNKIISFKTYNKKYDSINTFKV